MRHRLVLPALLKLSITLMFVCCLRASLTVCEEVFVSLKKKIKQQKTKTFLICKGLGPVRQGREQDGVQPSQACKGCVFCSGTEVRAGKTCKAGSKSRAPARYVENMSWGCCSGGMGWHCPRCPPHPCPPLGILRLLGGSQSFVLSLGSFVTPRSCHPTPPSWEPIPGFPSLGPDVLES